jgi:hypothetical protein
MLLVEPLGALAALLLLIAMIRHFAPRVLPDKITSQDKSRFPDYLPLPRKRCRGVLAKDSWLELKPQPLPVDAFRSYRGRCPSWVRTEIRGRELLPAGRRMSIWRTRV